MGFNRSEERSMIINGGLAVKGGAETPTIQTARHHLEAVSPRDSCSFGE
jgi:hypothetical protein